MKVNERDAQVLQSIHMYCKEIEDTRRLFGDREKIFLENHVYRNACSMAVQTIGELAKKLSNEFMEEYSKAEDKEKIPWREIKGMRTFIAHDYHGGIDMKKVWESIKTGVPALEEFCRETLQENNFEITRIKSVARGMNYTR